MTVVKEGESPKIIFIIVGNPVLARTFLGPDIKSVGLMPEIAPFIPRLQKIQIFGEISEEKPYLNKFERLFGKKNRSVKRK